MQETMREAERRIEEARRTRAKTLVLGDLELSELPASLGYLPDLQALYLGTGQPSEDENSSWSFFQAPSDFADLSPLAGLRGLHRLDLSECGSVRDLSPLAGLRALQSLDLVGTEVADLTPLARLEALRNLDLGGTGVTDLSPLAGLHGLERLDLWSTGVTDLSPLAGLQSLESLELRDCRAVRSLVPLAGLHVLQSLDLWSTGVADLAPLFGLEALQTLDLGNTGVTDLAPLTRLQALQSLGLWGTSVRDLAPLSGLQALRSLDLGQCRWVSGLAPMAGLQALRKLELRGAGVTDLAPLAGLQALRSLSLGITGVTNLSPLAGLQALQSLDLDECRGVEDLAPLAGLQALRSLELRNTGVTDLAPLGELRALRTLGVYGCRPPIPQELLRVLAVRLDSLTADEAVGVPREILSRAHDEDCLPRLRAYLSELDQGAEAENEVKVILLGNGGVGKTQLCRRFRGEPFDDRIASTHGVQIWREELRLLAGGEETTFQVSWWDFGGQDIYHGTHALFLQSRAVILILWTPELENREEHEENGIPLRNQPLAYWLAYVRALAGRDSPVIVVQSRCDHLSDRRPDPPRPKGLAFFECCSYSALGDQPGRETLESHLRGAIRYLSRHTGALAIGRGRAEVRRRLSAWRSEDQQREPAERRHRTLTLDEFQALCDEVGDVASWFHALDYFHQTGVVFHDWRLFDSRIVLDQSWALDAVYTVFHRGWTAPFLRDSGRFTREDLAFLAWPEHSVGEQKLFLDLMESCGICFPSGETSKGETSYIAPDLLPPFEAVAERVHLTWKQQDEIATLRLEYLFFHPALLRDLMRRIGRQAGDLAEYWKYGFWLTDASRDTQLLVQFEDTATGEAPGAGALELKAQGRDPLGLLREVRREIGWQRIGAEPGAELLTLGGTTVARSALSTRINDGRARDISGAWVDAGAFTAFFEEARGDDRELPGARPVGPRHA